MNPDSRVNGGPGWNARGSFAALLIGLLILAFPAVWLGSESLFFRDFGVLAYPTVHHHREAFWRGELPLWNPLSHCGVPFLAQWGTMVCYPGTLIYLLLPLPWSLNVFCLLHLWLAGFGMYRLAERWFGHPLAASVAGVGFAFGGVTLSCLLWPNYTVALGWMPWVILTAERAWREGGRRTLVAALTGTSQVLAGVPEVVGMTWLVVLAAWWFGGSPVPGANRAPAGGTASADVRPLPADPPAPWGGGHPPARRSRQAGRLALVLLLVASLTAVQLLPFLDLLGRSQRATGMLPEKWALPPWGWANLLVPLLHCRPTTQGVYFQNGQAFFSSVYVGGLLLALAVLGVGAERDRRRWWLAGLALLGVLLAVGEETPLLPLLRDLVPPVGQVRYPVKFMVLAAFAVPMLAAAGAWAWIETPSAHAGRALRRLLGVGGGLALIAGAALLTAYFRPLPADSWTATWSNAAMHGVLWGVGLALLVAWPRTGGASARAAVWLLFLATLWVDLRFQVPRQNPTLPAALLEPGLPDPPAWPRPGEGRVWIPPAAEAQLLQSRVSDFAQDYLGKRLALWSNLNLLEAVPKVSGAATLRIREQDEVQQRLESSPTAQSGGLADFLGVRWINSPSNVVEWVPRPTGMPWITAGQSPVFVDKTRALDRLVEPGFDPMQTVLLPLEARADWTGESADRAHRPRVSGERFASHRIEFAVESEGPAWVVIAQTHHPAWRASVDGQLVTLWRANHAFQAVRVPAGTHRIVLVYRDRWFQAGAAWSLLTLLAMFVLWRRARTESAAAHRAAVRHHSVHGR